MKIAIIGAAGSVGSCVAFNIAAQGLADEILMIGGSRQNHLQHHAMDISTGVYASMSRSIRAGTRISAARRSSSIPPACPRG